MRPLLLVLLVTACSKPGGPSNPALRGELLAMMDQDQAARATLVPDASGMLVGPEHTVEDVDARTTARMKQIIAQVGWPTRRLVGDDGAHAAWLLVQHADADLAFQKACLAAMEHQLATREVSPVDYAYLFDRVALHDGRKQRYGTQFADGREPFPIEDPANVDARRAEVGLPTLAEGIQQMHQKYGLQ